VRRIVQTDNTGCGIACLAMLAGVSYAEARRAVFGRYHPGDCSTSTGELRRGLRKLGIRAGKRLIPLRGRRLRSLETDAILKVNLGLDGYWHWVVWDAGRQVLRDPRRTPYKRCRAISYLPIG
jgi:ABC-type bacteriocin/lantibiotic exporter with double-glycine peptidase domain